MTPKEKKKWLKKLKPYWKLWLTMNGEWRKNEYALEKKMQKELGEELEFFYSDIGIAGIGHADYNRRKKGKNYFPLFHDRELGD